jgi:sugar phosphate isomerase/epimerase
MVNYGFDMTRRMFLAGAAAALRAAAPRTKMGIASTCYMTVWKPKNAREFLEHAIDLGAGGIQASLDSRDPDALKQLRGRAEESGLYIEAMAPMPRPRDSAAFAAAVGAAKQVGALCIRCAGLNGRRYETFQTLAAWQEHASAARAAIDAALRIAERERIPVAIENHKDWTAAELAGIMKAKSSEYLGVCLDTGNNIALLDDPMAVVETLAPYAISTHIKDMGVQAYEDGFLLSEMPLGEGMLDVKRIVSTIQKARPATRMTLEMITRDPLQVPCLTEGYWATFPQRGGEYLARALRMVRANAGSQALPALAGLDRNAQLRLEEDNVRQSLHYARQWLSL